MIAVADVTSSAPNALSDDRGGSSDSRVGKRSTTRSLAEELTEQLRGQQCAYDAVIADRDKQIAVLIARIDKLEHEAALARKQIVGPTRERMPEADSTSPGPI